MPVKIIKEKYLGLIVFQVFLLPINQPKRPLTYSLVASSLGF